jgi:hypothetical protein
MSPNTPGPGFPSVDAAIAAIQAGDVDTLMQQVAYEKHACVAPPDVQPLEGRPRCGAGETTGDLVDGFGVSQCEGYTIRSGNTEAIRDAIDDYVTEPLALYGAYHTLPTTWSGRGRYVAVFYAPPDRAGLSIVAILNDVGVVGIGTGCGNSPAQLAVSGAVQGPLKAR